mgnify:CR=1 FL=1
MEPNQPAANRADDKPSKPVVLVVMDGWGYSEDDDANAVNAANKPVWDRLWKECAHTLIGTSGSAVGLPDGQMGNSEVGHLNIGAGRTVYQEFTRVSKAIDDGSFAANSALTAVVDKAMENGGAVHLFGLLSPGGVHSHEDHIHAMVKMAVERGCKKIWMHAFLDGRDMPPKSAKASIEKMQQLFASLGCGGFADIVGRYYAMDRDQRWERVQQAYDLMTLGAAEFESEDPIQALEAAYERGETDEFVKPTRISLAGEEPVVIADGDAVVFMNYRSDRAREITQTFIDTKFDGFERRAQPKLAGFVSLTQYNETFDIPAAFPPVELKNGFGEYLSNLGLRQLRLAETEKYAHVTFFFNGGREAAFEGEERILIPSPKVATYDLQPEMSAREVTDKLVDAIENGKYDAVICNFANPDMVGHTGDFEAAKEAIEVLDQCLERVVDALHRADGEMLITADHGNAEQMIDRNSGQAHTAHTVNPVPLIFIGRDGVTLEENGALCDVTPTMLSLMELEQPAEMSGKSLIR